MEYSLMTPPFQIKNFEEMTEKDAKEHYEWYLSEIPNRLDLLEKAVIALKQNHEVKLNFSKDTLIDLWGWYIDNVQIIQKSDEEYQNELVSSNPMIKEFIKKEEIATGWLSIAMDISIYFAECLVKNNEVLNWGLVTKPKSLACANKPIIIGFKNNMKLDATNVIFVLTRKILKGDRKRDVLLQLYDNWASQI